MSTPRHIFNYVDGDDTACVGTDAVELTSLCEAFDRYLKACGFIYDGNVTICETDNCPHHEPPADLNPTEDGKEGV